LKEKVMADAKENATANNNNGQNCEDPCEIVMPTAENYDAECTATCSSGIEAELAAAQKEAAEYKDKYLRGLAESENLRKRLQKEKQELIQYAIQNVIVDFLPPIDHFENALRFTDQASDEVKHWAIGFQMILSQLKDVLTNNGVVPLKALGTPFDHNSHEAIEMIETTEHPAGTVIEESMIGYKMGERIIRPARVKVAKLPNLEAEALEELDEYNQQQ